MFGKSLRTDLSDFQSITESHPAWVELNAQQLSVTQPFRARTKLIFNDSRLQGDLSQVVVFNPPDQLRFELFASQLNKLLLFSMSVGGNLYALVPEQGVIYQGAADPINMTRVVGVPLFPGELARWIQGMGVVSDAYIVESEEVLVDAHGKRIIRDQTLVDGRRIISLYVPSPYDNGAWLPLSVEVTFTKNGKSMFYSKYEYGPFNSEKGFSFVPRQIYFELNRGKLSGRVVILDFKKIQEGFSEKARERLFSLPIDRYPMRSLSDSPSLLYTPRK